MSYETFGDLKTYAMDMMSVEETDAVYQKNLLARWGARVRDRITTHSSFNWKAGNIRLTWPTVGSSASQPITSVLYLPDDVGEILSMYPATLSWRNQVTIMDRWAFDEGRPSTARDSQGILVLWGYYAVKRDNPSTNVLTVTATGGVNADGLQCRIVGRDENNDGIEETVTLSAGTATTTNTFLGGVGLDGVTAFSILKSTLTPLTGVGTVKLLSLAVELESLNADVGELRKERRRTELYAQMGGAGVYNIAYYRRAKPLVAGSDLFLPGFPNEFFCLVEDGIMMNISSFRKEWDTKREYQAEFADGMKRLVAWDNRRPGQKGRFTVQKQFGARNHSITR